MHRIFFSLFFALLSLLSFFGISTMVFAAYADSPQTTITLTNPIGGTKDNKQGVTDIKQLVGTIIKATMAIVGSLMFVVFLYGGFQWFTSRGNSDKVRSGLDAMLWGAIGLFIIFGSYAILNTILTGLRQ